MSNSGKERVGAEQHGICLAYLSTIFHFCPFPDITVFFMDVKIIVIRYGF